MIQLDPNQCSAAAGQLKYEFVVHPGADPGQIRLAYRGASGLKRGPSGQLEISTPLGSLNDQAPWPTRSPRAARSLSPRPIQRWARPPQTPAAPRMLPSPMALRCQLTILPCR